MLGLITRLHFMVLLLGMLLSIASPKAAFALTWQSPPIVLGPPPTSFAPDLAVDPSGNAFSVWINGPTNEVQAARFSSSTGTYGTAVTLNLPGVPILGVVTPVVATDATQTALTLWQDLDANTLNAAYYNGTWQPSVVIASLPPNFGARPSISMDGSGNGLAVWYDESGGTPPGNVLAAFFDGGTQTWGAPQLLTPAGTGGIFPASDFSANGTAVAVWLDASNNVVASNYNGSTWTALPGTISVAPAANVSLSVGIDSTGNAVALWLDDGTSELFSSSYIGGVWSAPQSVSQAVGVVGYTFAMSDGGTAIATWTDGTTGKYSVYSGGTWSAPVTYSTDALNVGSAIDTVGNALLFVQGSSGNIFSYTLPIGGPLSSPVFIDSGANIGLGIAAEGYADNGRGFLTALVSNGEGEFVTGTFTELLSPLFGSIQGRVCKNKFANASERVKIITWVPIPNSLTVSYYVRRNGKLVAIIPASGPFKYIDRQRCKETDVYVVTSVDASGTESNPLTVSVK